MEEHARLDFSDFLFTLLAICHIIKEKFHPAHLLIYLVNKQAGWHFFPRLLAKVKVVKERELFLGPPAQSIARGQKKREIL